MNGYIYGQVHKQLWRQVGLCGQTEEKREGKQVNLISGGSACTPVDELKGRCACYAEKEEINCTVTVMNRDICGYVEQQKR